MNFPDIIYLLQFEILFDNFESGYYYSLLGLTFQPTNVTSDCVVPCVLFTHSLKTIIFFSQQFHIILYV